MDVFIQFFWRIFFLFFFSKIGSDQVKYLKIWTGNSEERHLQQHSKKEKGKKRLPCAAAKSGWRWWRRRRLVNWGKVFLWLCSSAFSLSQLRSFPVSVGVLPDDGGVAVVIVAPDGCCGGDEEGSSGGPVFASVSIVCALLPSPSLLRSFERCIHSLFSFFLLIFLPPCWFVSSLYMYVFLTLQFCNPCARI